jgi:hypothetical protein
MLVRPYEKGGPAWGRGQRPHQAESPLLLIGGQGAWSQHPVGSLQDLPHVDILVRA